MSKLTKILNIIAVLSGLSAATIDSIIALIRKDKNYAKLEYGPSGPRFKG